MGVLCDVRSGRGGEKPGAGLSTETVQHTNTHTSTTRSVLPRPYVDAQPQLRVEGGVMLHCPLVSSCEWREEEGDSCVVCTERGTLRDRRSRGARVDRSMQLHCLTCTRAERRKERRQGEEGDRGDLRVHKGTASDGSNDTERRERLGEEQGGVDGIWGNSRREEVTSHLRFPVTPMGSGEEGRWERGAGESGMRRFWRGAIWESRKMRRRRED